MWSASEPKQVVDPLLADPTDSVIQRLGREVVPGGLPRELGCAIVFHGPRSAGVDQGGPTPLLRASVMTNRSFMIAIREAVMVDQLQ